ncbi:MAG: hypothetical protein R3Y28_01065 [Candidatus Gastranaerophilales bacterium]
MFGNANYSFLGNMQYANPVAMQSFMPFASNFTPNFTSNFGANFDTNFGFGGGFTSGFGANFASNFSPDFNLFSNNNFSTGTNLNFTSSNSVFNNNYSCFNLAIPSINSGTTDTASKPFGTFTFSSTTNPTPTSTATTTKKTSNKIATSTTKLSSSTKKYTNFNLSKEFLDRTKEIAKNLNCDYKDLLALMNSESAIKTTSKNKRRDGYVEAVGLIQFTNASITELERVYGIKTSKEEILKMSDMEQLDLTEKYLKLAKSYRFSSNAKLSAGDLYAITFAPGRADQNILYSSGSDAYTRNPLDLDGDGHISKTDLANHLARKQVNVTSYEAVA